MCSAIALRDITIHPVVEQQGPFFDVFEFFPKLTKEMVDELPPRRTKLSETLRRMTVEAPFQSLAIAFLLGVLIARRR